MYSDRDLVIDSILLLFMAVARISIGFVCETRLSSVNNNYYNIVIVGLPVQYTYTYLLKIRSRDFRKPVLSQPIQSCTL